MSRLDDIKARLEAGTKGPLLIDDKEQTVRVGYAGEILFDKSSEGSSYWAQECRPNAELIAHAPTDLAALVAVVEEVQRIRDTMLRQEGQWEYPEHRYANLLSDALRPVTGL